ncbi:host cell division inhibitory peptide Kil [Escherichia coli O170:H18]|uniref:host cell division inhibitory peptide Kil n=1 Tax=Escherichia coli TaxID=562 RepID=UPI001C1FABF3|nr:host cell division inhibitory peptide Kil [Escherichia coli]EEQ5902641.1 host cell division inhibitory peptide Kil [Escherichia coli]EKY6397863.1 host cell division inhibitory peptide Kil [Escherichia coli]QWV75217.1 host cell division inhibitory peptide Kil [Escherichia coli O170:H18]
MINQYLLKVAQSKLAIAQCIGDSNLWNRAMNDMKQAIGSPWYRKENRNINKMRLPPLQKRN